jgi:hypothetical protein
VQGIQCRIGWTPFLLATALLVLGAPLGRAAFDRATILTKSSETGYLLYPRTPVCAPPQAGVVAAATGTTAMRRYWVRPTRTANAVMPPALGQTLNPESLTSR